MKYIFIDIDNTILDFDAYVKNSMEVGFQHFGLKPFEPWMFDIFTRENNILWHRIEVGTLDFTELKKIRWNTIFSYLDIDFDGEIFEAYFRDFLYESAIPIDGAMELLQALHDRYTLCVASNGPYNQQVNRLKTGKMLDFFDHIFVSQKLGISKPEKAFFDAAFKELAETYGVSVDPQDCLMIGDSITSDMTGGINAGMKTCYFNRKKKAYELEGIDYEVTELKEIPELEIFLV